MGSRAPATEGGVTGSAATPTAPPGRSGSARMRRAEQARTRSGGDWDPIPADVVTALWIGRVRTSRKRTDADTHQRWDGARPTTVALIVDVKRSMFLVLTVADAQGPRSSMRKSGVSLFPPITHGFRRHPLGLFRLLGAMCRLFRQQAICRRCCTAWHGAPIASWCAAGHWAHTTTCGARSTRSSIAHFCTSNL